MREHVRRLLRRVVVFALDGPPALVEELAEMKDKADDEMGSLDDRITTLEEREEVTTDDVDSAIDRLRDEVADRYAETDHDHDDAIDDAVAALERTLNNKLAGIYVRLVALEPPKEEVTN